MSNEGTLEFDPLLDELDENGRILRKWQMLAGGSIEDPVPEEERDFAYFFQSFRPHGEQLKEVFENVNCGEAMLPRMLEIYGATADGYEGGGFSDGYFVVTKPRSLTDAEALSLAQAQCQGLIQICKAMNSTLLQKPPKIKVVRGADEPGERSEFESELRQLCAQHFQSLPRRDSLAWMLSEACFTVANDFDLTRYMMWPLVEDANDPYRPYFELWRCGGILRFDDSTHATVHLPGQ